MELLTPDRAARAARVRAGRASRMAGAAERRARIGGSQVLHRREAQRLRSLAAAHLADARLLERLHVPAA